jgi:hypothetical protein
VSPGFPQVDSDVQHVDGVDVAQLLHDIGEASANESSVELFRLCLGAQRVLAAMIGDRVTS